MKIAVASLASRSPYGQSKFYKVEKLKGEQPDAYEARTWRNRMHKTKDGNVIIPGISFANSLKDAAKYMSIKIKGRGQATYTKHFDCGVFVPRGLVLPNKVDSVAGVWVMSSADGKPGGGKRVAKCFPCIPEWSGEVVYGILDDIIDQDVFHQILVGAGMFIGGGYWRPARRGNWGRYGVEGLKWIEDPTEAQCLEFLGPGEPEVD